MKQLICLAFPLFLLSIGLAVQNPPTAIHGSKNLSDMIDLVRSSIVRIQVDLENPRTEIPADLQYRGCFKSGTCVVGTGFFVNESGDVVTAWHVVNGASAIIQVLQQRGILSACDVGYALPNVEKNGKARIAFNFVTIPYRPLALDRTHDVSILSHAGPNPFQIIPQVFVGPASKEVPNLKPMVARMYNARPRDGDEVFACGFPMGAESLETTAGRIATVWGEEDLAAVQNSNSEKSEVYKLDLRINFGNSGGPVFRSADQAVIGIVHGVSAGISGEGTAVTVPARYVTDLLKANGRPWHSSGSVGRK